MGTKKISAAAARRIAIAAQGIDRPRPANKVDVGHIRRAVRGIGALQLDFVNVLVPAHELVLFSRLGPYERERFHRAVYRGGQFTEQWAHEASIVPVELWPVLRHRREDYRPWANSPIMKLNNKSKYLQETLELTQENGPITSGDLPQRGGPRRRPGDWHRSLPRWALEYHFGKGHVAVLERRGNFQRVYDLAERVIGAEHFGRVMDRHDAERELLRRAARACGIGTGQDLADYYRMSPRVAAPRIRELVEAGELIETRIENTPGSYYLDPRARCPRRVRTARILSPFDPLLWFRPRTERLFEFRYRIEIYVPAHRRIWGYYVLPFLLDDRLVARVDLKAQRRKGCLDVLASYGEEGIEEERVASALASELRLLADWLGLAAISNSRKGSLARALGAALRG